MMNKMAVTQDKHEDQNVGPQNPYVTWADTGFGAQLEKFFSSQSQTQKMQLGVHILWHHQLLF